MNTYDYIWESTKDQKTDRQDIALRSAGVAEGTRFIGRLSGKNFDRPAYQRLIKSLSRVTRFL